MPAPGTVTRFRPPLGSRSASTRTWSTAIPSPCSTTLSSPYVLVWAEDRLAAVRRARRALTEFELEGSPDDPGAGDRHPHSESFTSGRQDDDVHFHEVGPSLPSWPWRPCGRVVERPAGRRSSSCISGTRTVSPSRACMGMTSIRSLSSWPRCRRSGRAARRPDHRSLRGVAGRPARRRREECPSHRPLRSWSAATCPSRLGSTRRSRSPALRERGGGASCERDPRRLARRPTGRERERTRTPSLASRSRREGRTGSRAARDN